MIKKTIIGLVSAGLIAGSIGVATATPLTFEINAETSGVSLSNVTGWNGTEISASLSNNLKDPKFFTLDDNNTQKIDFIDFTVTSAGNDLEVGTFDITANLAFLSPVGSDHRSDGDGGYVTFGGFFTVGGLTWNTPSRTLTIEGNSVKISFEEGLAWGLGSPTTTTLHAYITNNGGATDAAVASVPEPSTILTVGILMLGLAGYNRKRFRKKVQ